MTTIEIKRKSFKVASCWNELSYQQLLQVIRVMHGQHEINFAYLLLLKIMGNIPTLFWNSLTLDHVSDFIYLPEQMVATRLTRQLIPQQGILAGPVDNFDNLVMSEFVFTESYWSSYRENENSIEALDKLCACLFRPVRTLDKNGLPYDISINADGDMREPFRHNECMYYAVHEVSRWDIHVKLAIHTWYGHCRLQLIEDFPAPFEGGTGEPAKYGLVTMMRNVAQAGTHGSFADVEQLPVKLALVELDEIISEAKQIESMHPKSL